MENSPSHPSIERLTFPGASRQTIQKTQDPMIFTFKCSYCSHLIEAPDEMLGQQIVCSCCGREQTVRAMVVPPVRAARSQTSDAEKITQLARGFVMWTMILILIGCLGTLVLLWLLTGADYGIPNLAIIGVLFCGSCFGLAFWLYLVGQIIHIRALLAKRKETERLTPLSVRE
jgi:hypothetical protein